MAFTPSKVWAPGDILEASDLQGNLDELKVYNHAIETAAFNALTPWAGPQQIMQGVYEATPNRLHLASGVFTGHVVSDGTGQYTYATGYTTGTLGDDKWTYLPRTARTLELRKGSTIFCRYWATAVTQDNDANNAFPFPVVPGSPTYGYADVALFMKNISPTSSFANVIQKSRSRSLLEDVLDDDDCLGGAGDMPDYDGKSFNRHFLSGFEMVDVPDTGEYSIGLVYNSDTAKSQVISWGLSVEAFYL